MAVVEYVAPDLLILISNTCDQVSGKQVLSPQFDYWGVLGGTADEGDLLLSSSGGRANALSLRDILSWLRCLSAFVLFFVLL